jgi:hypothetical protein
MNTLERGDSNLYEPLRSKFGKPLFQKNEPLGFVFKTPPKEAVLFKHGKYVVISVAKLKEAQQKGWQKPSAAPPPAPAPAPAPGTGPAPTPGNAPALVAPAPAPVDEPDTVEREGDEG